MKIFRFERTLDVPYARDQIFPFFSNADNLDSITPPWLHFQITSPTPIDMAVGTMIHYNLRLHAIPIRWVSEITAWEPPYRFVDEQRKGPYLQWIHEHRFEQRDSGTTIIDCVDYAVLGGALINKLFVLPDLQRVFDYRHSILRDRFGWHAAVPQP